MRLLLIVYFIVALIVIFFGCSFIVLLMRKQKTGGVETLISEFHPDNETPKTPQEMIDSEEYKEYLRIDNDHSMEKQYIRFCIDELTQYPSEYILTLKESEPLPDYSEKGMEDTPSFRKLCAKIKDLAKLDDCACVDPKICKLPFSVNNLEGGCDSFSEICDGSDEPYVSFWLKRYVT